MAQKDESDNCLYLEIKAIINRIDDDSVLVEAPLETIIMLCVHEYCQVPSMPINFIVSSCESCVKFPIKLSSSDERTRVFDSNRGKDVPWPVEACKLPTMRSGGFLSAGIAAAARRLIRLSETLQKPPVHPQGLLGFRESCLQAPNETSVWTKFCEIELVNTVSVSMNHLKNSSDSFLMPNDIMRFESHLRHPLRIHNIYKLARDVAKLSFGSNDTEVLNKNENETSVREKGKSRKWKSNKKIINSSTPVEDLGLSHDFSEGPYLTLADILLYPSFYLILSCLKDESLLNNIPETLKWFNRLKCLQTFNEINVLLSECKSYSLNLRNIDITSNFSPENNFSLYKCDPKRNLNKKRHFTKDSDVELALEFIEDDLELNSQCNDNENCSLDWSKVPSEASPLGGHLPDVRMVRKSQQLENLATAVIKIAKDGDKIVDFCSGGGHLGIILAYLLPKCTIILLENKEQSLKRAQIRVQNLKLSNVYYYQCNLDFFKGSFDIGVALHACGVSTDLVLENCINRDASFVICPCCYGSLHETSRLRYPRSQNFSQVPVEHYMCIGHAADQTHTDHPLEKRGSRCMGIIDSDRARHAINHGYDVTLKRLKPLSCTPKNNMIIGIKNKQ